MKHHDITASNRAAWDEAAPLHRAHNQADLLARFAEPGHSELDEVETAVLTRLGVVGKDVAQLCCNNGRELISVRNLGARRCVGFEGAAGFVEQARELNAAAGLDCAFMLGDVYEIPTAYDEQFDVVTVTIGVLNWMPDVDKFFAVAARLLRPGGALFIYEQHPIMDMVEPGAAGDPVAWNYPYFRQGPRVYTEGLDYFGGTTYEAKPVYEIQHTLSAVIMAGVKAGLGLSDFAEYPHHISNTWYNVERQGPQLPMCYTLVMEKI
ncbi:class I SAM-dependent methyltransferase [Magnetovibrio sp.]|uniref:class I SAM-dependent methyltransferase n=1 Tax=Magnetovibrio sp. TaxID=2024836 RepID=UPI002F94B342